jgi:hypothetical protein
MMNILSAGYYKHDSSFILAGIGHSFPYFISYIIFLYEHLSRFLITETVLKSRLAYRAIDRARSTDAYHRLTISIRLETLTSSCDPQYHNRYRTLPCLR